MSPIRKDGDGRPEFAHSWESLTERQIRESMASGDFDNLPFQGERIPIDDDGSDMALAHHVLRQAGFAPGWIGTDAEIRRLLQQRDAILARVRRAGPPPRERDRAAIRAIVETVNRLVLQLEHEAPTPRQHRRRLDLAEELQALERGAIDDDPPGKELPDRR
jgi:DnaJ homologue, subfamily C, member 28, conserved domain